MALEYLWLAAPIGISGCMCWAYALWPFGVWASVAGGVCGGVVGVVGAWPLARFEERAHVEGGLRRWTAVAVTLVSLWLALVIAPSAIGAMARFRPRPQVDVKPVTALDTGRVNR